MGEDVLSLVQRRAAEICCPVCGRAQLDVRLRCDLGEGVCVVAARCEQCKTTFRVDHESFAVASGSDAKVVLSCDAITRSCTLKAAV